MSQTYHYEDGDLSDGDSEPRFNDKEYEENKYECDLDGDPNDYGDS